MTAIESAHPRMSLNRVVRTWWPLAASWLLMSAEQPAFAAVVARLAEPKINLAAWGGIVFPLALIIESPIIMLLAASTALSKDRESFLWLRRFMMWGGAILTALHVLVAFTPVYYLVAERILGAPAEIIEPARLGLMIMTPWTWAIAYRRFNQGLLIRFGHSRAVGIGTLLRLATDGLVLAVGYAIGTIPGIVVGATAIAVGVVAEAVYAGLRVRPVLREQVHLATPVEPALDWRSFLSFYIPLAMTSLLMLLVQPIGSASLSRMPQALVSLAVWPVVSGFLFIFRSLGISYNEVVVTLLDEPAAEPPLRRFVVLLIAWTTGLLLLIVATPLASFWFGRVSALSPDLVTLARRGLWLALPLPGLTVLQNWYQGNLVHRRRTGSITEGVVVFLLTVGVITVGGVLWGQVPGLYVVLVAFSVGILFQTTWLWWRCRCTVL